MIRRLFHKLLNKYCPFFGSLHPDNLPVIKSALDRANRASIPGDYYEFGVYSGFSLWYATTFDRPDRYYIGFDSFEGLPNPSKEDKGEFAFRAGSLFVDIDFTRKILERYVSAHVLKKVVLVKGFYSDLLHNLDSININKSEAYDWMREVFNQHPKKAAVILIDCDLYESTKQALQYMTSRIEFGHTVIIIDDYNFKGQQKAFHEWLNLNSITAEPFFKNGSVESFILRKGSL